LAWSSQPSWHGNDGWQQQKIGKSEIKMSNADKDLDQRFLNFSKYVRRHELARFIVQYELFRKIADVKGSIVECGVYQGAGVMTWAKLSETLEPYNFLRKIYGFDTFEGFPAVSDADMGSDPDVAKVGHLKPGYDVYAELGQCIDALEETRLLKHQEKVILIKGDAMQTIPAFLKENQQVLVSLLYLDFDLYEPTLLALKSFLPRMPKGAVIAFDELNDPKWPGETRALLEALDINRHRLEFLPFEPHISWITLD
jgi:hypothetical protein